MCICASNSDIRTTSAPYLAIGVLQQLAEVEEPNFQAAIQILQIDTYVDDVTSGAETLQEAIKLQK